ncbi:Eco57I restriction-modification methylase domain-containing protein [Candidatus Bathyarchaeota archaeon]|nr:Eco57I restriction-modification methylase domain-containing protein [Candidatus Bathyarchaeota archaeon]
MLETGALDKERQNYFKFALIVLQDILGYSIRKDLDFEAGNVEFSFRNPSTGKSVCIEVKGASTKDLFADQYRIRPERQTPIKQTWDYMGSSNFDYGIATNYRDFVLIDKSKGYSRYHLFDVMSIKENESKLKEFIAIFSKKSILDEGFIPKLYLGSVIEEREFTKQFYKLYHETRLMLIKEFQDSRQATKAESLHNAQLFLNRMIFLFFLQASGKIRKHLFTEAILQSLNPHLVSEHSRFACDTILSLFESLDKGSQTPVKIFGYNGGLFRDKIPAGIFFKDMRNASFFEEALLHSTLKKQMKLDELSQAVIDRFRDKLNPIISNLLILSSFDFESDLNVNILGHIFEQSITDLEQLQQQGTFRRKREGIFYTPDYVTDFICRNAIISYLSKKGASHAEDLISEYSHDISELEEKLKRLKILDPACGSGHFLLKAVDILLEIFRGIQTVKESQGMYTIATKGRNKSEPAKQFTLSKWNEESEARRIIESSIFGVDINEESVEITKLALFLRIATSDRKLLDLSQNIKVGNSIVDDKAVDAKAFNWSSEFPDVEGRFDIIIGNPPYIRVQFLDHKIVDWLKQHRTTAFRRVDISTLFIELAKNLLKDGGIVSYISSNQFQVTEYGRKTREFILKNFRIKSIINFGDLPVFEDALTYVSIFTLQNSPPSNFKYLRIKSLDGASNIDFSESTDIDIESLNDNSWVLGSKSQLEMLQKLREHPPLSKIGNAGTGLFTGLDKVLLLEKTQVDSLSLEQGAILPVLRGTDPDRYIDPEPSMYVIYPYKLQDGLTVVFDEEELKTTYPNAYRYLLNNKDRLLKRKDSRKTFLEKKYWYALTRFGRLENFKRPKIVTPGEVRDHKFTIDRGGAGFLNARVFSVLIDDKRFDLRYVLGLLNSSVVRFFLQNTAPLKQGGYFTYSSKFLNDVPIPEADSFTQGKFIDAVEELLALNRKASMSKNRFLSRLMSNLKARPSRRLMNFESISFADLVDELSKQNIKLTLVEQDEWEHYFDQYKNETLSLKLQIKEKDSKLDEMAADVYRLGDERKFIGLDRGPQK